MRLLCELSNFIFSWIGAAALGGFLGEDVVAFVSAVISGAAGTYVLTMMGDADVGTDLPIQPGQHAAISGDPSLGEAPAWGSGGFMVQQSASLSLTHVSLSADALTSTMANFGHGGHLALDGVMVVRHSELGVLTGVVTRGAGLVLDPPDLQLTSFCPATFIVLSGPCTLAEGGRCVGRWPGGYLPDEDCEIAVAGGGGVLGPCPVFDTDGSDKLTLPDGVNYDGSNCPAGGENSNANGNWPVLTTGQTLHWHSNADTQGHGQAPVRGSNEQTQRGINMQPGGGWQVCFA
jgi:hypothetical protein